MKRGSLMTSSSSKTALLFRWLVVFCAAVLLWMAAQAWRVAEGLRHHTPMAFAKAILIMADAGLVLLWAGAPQRWQALLAFPWRIFRKLGRLRWILLVGWLLALPYLVLYSPYAAKFESPWVRWLLYFNFALGAALLLSRREGARLTTAHFIAGALLTAAVFAFSAAYTHVSSYPFRLSWSEGNRLWDYSLMFARERYLYPPNRPIPAHIDPGRQFLWGLIYLVPHVSIFWVRLWNAFLFTAPYLLFAWVAFLKPRSTRAWAFWAGLWGFLFLNQGPIYTPLLLSALGVALAEMGAPWWLGLPLVAGATYYAALTRYTWTVAPPLWAAILVLGEAGRQSDWRSLRKKGWWLVGGALLGAVLSGRIPSLVATAFHLAEKYLGKIMGGASGASVAAAAANSGGLSLKQPLLWNRLWPNPTFAPGIVLGVIIAVGPVVLLWWVWRRERAWALQPWAQMAIGAILAALLAVGIVISLKIGGGSNLHNLDMFLVAVLFVTVVFWRQGGGKWLQAKQWSPWAEGVLLALVLAPMYFVFLQAHPRDIPPEKVWKPALEAVQAAVRQAQEQGGEVLFIDQRQLLTFGYVPQVPLIPEYEKKYMMDQAMANNGRYFARYYQDLARHRFALIVTEPLVVHNKSEKEANFASENNAWVQWVSAPTLCYYEPLATFKKVNLQLLVPRKEPTDCTEVLPVSISAPSPAP